MDHSSRNVSSNALFHWRDRAGERELQNVEGVFAWFYTAVNLGKPVKSWKKEGKERCMQPSKPVLIPLFVSGREWEREKETHSLSMMSLRANGSMQWYLSAFKLHLQPLCMAAHMVLQHHIFTMLLLCCRDRQEHRDAALGCALTSTQK